MVESSSVTSFLHVSFTGHVGGDFNFYSDYDDDVDVDGWDFR